jgi:hypothetical protein
MSQSPPHSVTEELDQSSAALSDKGVTQAPTIDNLDQCLDGEVTAARGVGMFALASRQCMSPSWLTWRHAQIPPYRKSGNARSRSSPLPLNRMTPCVTLIPPHPRCLLQSSDLEDRTRMPLCANIVRGRP